jgi:hypothetical protein
MEHHLACTINQHRHAMQETAAAAAAAQNTLIARLTGGASKNGNRSGESRDDAAIVCERLQTKQQ